MAETALTIKLNDVTPDAIAQALDRIDHIYAWLANGGPEEPGDLVALDTAWTALRALQAAFHGPGLDD